MLFEGLQLGRYRLIRLIGRGGTGEVYLAEDQRITRQVALKLVRSEDPTSDAARDAARLFQREAQTIAMLGHPNILPLFDFGEEIIDGTTFTYLVTPYCPEGSLATWLRHRGTPILTPLEVLHIIQQAADALEYAHDKQIVHRDVKPSNFLVRTRKDNLDRPDLLLADFGIARLSQATMNASKTIRGTPMYMGPEQWSSSAVPATDQYALGVMAYELLTGRPPFQGTQEQMMYHHIITQPPPPSSINARLTPTIDAVILRALSKQPEARFPSVSGFARAFQQALAEQPPMTSMSYTSPYIRAIVSPPTPHFTPPISRETPHISTSGIVQSNEHRLTLNISSSEAMEGVDRTVVLPGKQQVKVAVPAGAYDGQVIRIENPAESPSPNTPRENLVLTIAVTPTPESAVIEAIPGLPPPRIKWGTLTLIVLAIVVLIASIVGFTSFGINLASTNSINATATANSGIMQTHQATFSAATASAAAGATAAAQIEATTTITANPYTSGQKILALHESLNSNSPSRWDETSGNCTFTSGGYHVISSTQATPPQVCVARSLDFNDFTFQVQMNTLKGDGGGILLRSTSSAAYYFRVVQDGKYALFACAGTGTSCSKPLTGGFSSAITVGRNQSNLIAVVAKGNHIELYVNGERIDVIDDATSLHGQIGVVAEAGSEVVFRDAKVWTM